MSDKDTVNNQRQYAWNYFQLHASQRMASFNFFVAISALLTAGMAETFDSGSVHGWLGMLLGASLIIVSFTFWQLDRRVRFLIKHSEAALKNFEKVWLASSTQTLTDSAMLFLSEEQRTKETRKECEVKPSSWHMSYAQCFGIIYAMFGIIGFVGLVMSIVKMP